MIIVILASICIVLSIMCILCVGSSVFGASVRRSKKFEAQRKERS